MQDIVVDHDSVSIHIAAAQDFVQSETIDLPFTAQILRCGVGRKLQLDRLIVPTLPMRMLRHHRGGDHQNRRVPRIFLGLAVPLEDHFPVRIPVIRNLVVDQPVGLVDGHPAYQLPILRRQVVPQQPTRRSGETGPQRALPLVSPAFVAGIHPMPHRERGSHSHRLGDRFCFRNAGNRRIVHPEFQRHGQRERFAGHRTDVRGSRRNRGIRPTGLPIFSPGRTTCSAHICCCSTESFSRGLPTSRLPEPDRTGPSVPALPLPDRSPTDGRSRQRGNTRKCRRKPVKISADRFS